MAEKHEATEVEKNMAILREAAPEVAAAMKTRVRCTLAPAGCTAPPEGAKLCHFIRHGEGHHNAAQRAWREDPSWDGITEPYTIDNDPDYKYVDAELNEKGLGQAVELQKVTEPSLQPQLLVVSPMRRATQTGLLAFTPHVERGELPVLAHELCHERAGRHTCDKRLAKTALASAFPRVDYSMLAEEEDPFWGDGVTREPCAALGMRAGQFTDWLMARPEGHIAIAAHSAFLLATFNAALDCPDDPTRRWFGTGEMRSVLLSSL